METIINGRENEMSPTMALNRGNPIDRLRKRTEDPMERTYVIAIPHPGFAFLVRKLSWARFSVLLISRHPC
jgi:hypothetical protein